MEKEEELQESATPCLHLVSAFFACEPPDFVISYARDFGGGSITERVQSFIWNGCINKSDVKCNGPYLKRFLKKLIVEIESNGDVVLDELYEKYIFCLAYVKDDELAKGNTRMLRRFSFLFPKDCSQASSCQIFGKLEVTLQCSLNMLEGDTGCSIWPSGLFLSEFILSFPEVFSGKSCLEVGSGVGLVGVCLGQANCSKKSLVEWQKVTLPKAIGGLGVRDLKLHNKGLLMKWLWRYGQPEAGYWKGIILAKYGAQNHWSANKNREPHGVGVWKHINNLQEDFFQKISFKAGNGLHIKFWEDLWLGESTLKIAFPRLYRIASNRDASIAQYREGNVWSPIFRRNLQDWEINDLLQLLGALENYILAEAPDRIIWGNSKKGKYTVKQCYEIGCSENGLLENWPWKHVWRTRQPLKVICFTWTALKGACLTQDNLRRRGIILINRCHLCYQTTETVNHLFLHCPVTAAVWHFFFSLFGLSWVMPSSIKDAFESWILWRVDKSIKRIWRMIPATIFWCIWKERNNRCFDGKSTPTSSLKGICLGSLFSWHFHTPVNSVDNFLDFVGSLTLI